MHEISDAELLVKFARSDSEAAFAEIVRRHIALVHSVALRHTNDPQHAQEITQAVFIILARKAASFGRKTILSGWLHHTARLTAANFQRAEFRRIRREQEAFMQSTLEENSSDTVWIELAPHLDDAMAKLGATDRDAVVLRYFENKSLVEVGKALGMEERATQKRVARALEKLRAIFAQRGVVSTITIIAGVVSANSVQAVPASLTTTIAATVTKSAAVSGSTFTLVKGTLKLMAWTKMKTAIVVGASLLLAAGTTTVMLRTINADNVDEKWFELSGTILGNAPDNLEIIRPTHFGKRGSGMVGKSERIVSQNLPLEWGLIFADKFTSSSPTRLVLPEGFPKDHFDYLITLPPDRNDSSQDGVRRIIKEVIKKKFGFTTHRETRQRDVLLLQVKNRDATGLQKTDQDSSDGSSSQSSVEGFNSQNIPMEAVVANLENHLGIPVRDQTGLTNRFNIDLRWNKQPGETTVDTTKRVVLEQLGLELVPGQESVEMLVVERVKH